MDAKHWQKVKSLFESAQELSPNERKKFLERACGEDVELRQEIEKLLESFEEADTSFLEKPAANEVASLILEKETLALNKTTGEVKNGNFVAGTVLENRYRIIGLLGKGGMGEVYKAEDLKLDQTVALKFLPDKLAKNGDALKRLVSEVRTARQVAHQNVCKVFDIGETGGRHFLSMEYIDGDDLSSLLRRVGRLSSDKASEISRQICMGLHAIHSAGILHRDLKPANIIIDSNGKARITDFGIAGLEEDVSKENIRVGTPAYMSPEQITGRDVTTKSDIYSLGLLLYEIYTGKQAFRADSINDLIEKHKTETPTNPSEFVENINPIVEKVINKCLEKEPENRPQSALHVALALPGGNPLEAAIAAGETPSPEMVAAAPKKGVLRPTTALACLTALIVSFMASILLQNYKTYTLVPLEKSPEVLTERARAILGEFGYKYAPVDTEYKFDTDPNYLAYASENDADANRWQKLRAGQPFALYFWYRQSPRYLEPKESYLVTESDPPLTVSGMANVKLDTRGRLIEFIAVPPQSETTAKQNQINWTSLFTEAGLDISNFKQTEPRWTPPVFASERAAWEGSYADFSDIPIRIEAAAYGGKPVYFRVVAPWDKPAREEEASANIFFKAAGIVVIIIYVLILIGAILLARHNLKVGRGDLKGGLKLTLFFFLILFFGQIIYADHVPTLNGELTILYEIVSYALFAAAFVGLVYIALEPFVRRWWSELLISWNRLLAGDFRDPMIGRDVLIGGLCGIGHSLAIYLGVFLSVYAIGSDRISDDFSKNSLNGLAGIITGFLIPLADSILMGLSLLFLLLLFYVVLRNKQLSVLLIGLIIGGTMVLAFVLTNHWILATSAVLIITLVLFALVRFGLLASISFWFYFSLSWTNPITFDPSSFYFPSTVLTIAIAFALAVYAFYISIAGQPIFRSRILKDLET